MRQPRAEERDNSATGRASTRARIAKTQPVQAISPNSFHDSRAPNTISARSFSSSEMISPNSWNASFSRSPTVATVMPAANAGEEQVGARDRADGEHHQTDGDGHDRLVDAARRRTARVRRALMTISGTRCRSPCPTSSSSASSRRCRSSGPVLSARNNTTNGKASPSLTPDSTLSRWRSRPGHLVVSDERRSEHRVGGCEDRADQERLRPVEPHEEVREQCGDEQGQRQAPAQRATGKPPGAAQVGPSHLHAVGEEHDEERDFGYRRDLGGGGIQLENTARSRGRARIRPRGRAQRWRARCGPRARRTARRPAGSPRRSGERGPRRRSRESYRKLTNCRSTSRSLPLSSAIVACRSSRLLDCTRSSSPWICAFTLLGPSSRMILATFFASSEEMPFLRPPRCGTPCRWGRARRSRGCAARCRA